MNIRINDVLYENINWNDNVLLMVTDMSLNEIEEAFSPQEDVTFSIYEDDTEVARYYNKGISRMTVTGTNPRTVAVEFNLTQLDEAAEDRLQSNLDDSDNAIEELAAVIAELSDLDFAQAQRDISQAVATVNAWTDRITTIEQFIVQLNILETLTDLRQRLEIVEGQIDDLRFGSSTQVPTEVVDNNEEEVTSVEE